jgi:hypothetical protein
MGQALSEVEKSILFYLISKKHVTFRIKGGTYIYFLMNIFQGRKQYGVDMRVMI